MDLDLDKTIIPFSILLIVVMALMYVIPVVGDSMGDTLEFEESVESVSVFFKEGYTDATTFKAAIYDEDDEYIVATAEGAILNDAWNTATFSTPVLITNGHEYSIMVSANGDFSIPSDVPSGWIEETTSGYGVFPSTIDSDGDTAQLSIYASYV